MDKWFVVVGNDKTDNSYRMAYQSREHAMSVAKSNDFSYPHSGPWRVIELAVVEEPVSA